MDRSQVSTMAWAFHNLPVFWWKTLYFSYAASHVLFRTCFLRRSRRRPFGGSRRSLVVSSVHQLLIVSSTGASRNISPTTRPFRSSIALGRLLGTRLWVHTDSLQWSVLCKFFFGNLIFGNFVLLYFRMWWYLEGGLEKWFQLPQYFLFPGLIVCTSYASLTNSRTSLTVSFLYY